MADGDFSWHADASGDRFVIRGPLARITLLRTADRWTHELALGPGVDADATPPLIQTEETAPDHADPTRIVSPVYQELQRHLFAGDGGRGICVLLTGHLFQHHFSAAVSFSRDPADPRRIVLDVDLADRCRAPVASLAATYLVRLGGGDLADANDTSVTWSVAGLDRLELTCDIPGRLALAEAGRTATRVQALAGLHPTLFTHRLRYRWRWLAPALDA